jgi:hypothetical protein
MSLRSRLALGLAVLTVALGTPVMATALPVEPAPRSAAAAPLAPGDPARLTLIVPLTVPPTETGLLDADTLTRYTAPLGLLTRQLDALADAPVAIGLDPMIAASIRALGTTAPPTALAWLQRLEGVSNEVFALAYADADVAAAASTGSLGLLSPLGFDFAVDPGNFGAAQTASPTPTPTPSATPDEGAIPPLPTLEDLLAWPYTLEHVAWPADDTLTAGTTEAIGAAGYESVILSSTNVSDPGPTTDLGNITGVVSDAPLSQLVRAATFAPSELDLQSALEALDASLASFASANPGGEVVATLDRHWPFLSYHLSEVLARLTASPSVVFGTLAETIERPAVDATVTDHPEAAGRLSVIESALSAVAAEAQFATVLTDPLLITAPRRLDLLALLSVSWLPDQDGWAASSATFLARSAELLSSVRITHGSDLLLLSRSTEVRVAVSNSLPYPVTVRITITPQRPLLRVMENQVLLEVEQDATKTAFIPVEAIANGVVTIHVELTSPTGVPIDSGFVRARLQAEWETVGTVVILGIIVLIFGFGIVRTVLKRRRAKAAAQEAPPDEASPAETSATEE